MKPTRAQKRPGARENLERGRLVLGVMDQAFTDYERGLIALRRRVVASLKRDLRKLGVHSQRELVERCREGGRL